MFNIGDMVEVISYTDKHYEWNHDSSINSLKRDLIGKQGIIRFVASPYDKYFIVDFDNLNWAFHEDDLKFIMSASKDWITEGF